MNIKKKSFIYLTKCYYLDSCEYWSLTEKIVINCIGIFQFYSWEELSHFIFNFIFIRTSKSRLFLSIECRELVVLFAEIFSQDFAYLEQSLDHRIELDRSLSWCTFYNTFTFHASSSNLIAILQSW